ncbi:MAG: translation initiation factor IF-2 subunit gamma [Conexivisphaerales archaeon]
MSSSPKRRIPRQSEVNIGTAGHVDHGKCLAIYEKVILDDSEFTGEQLEKLAISNELYQSRSGEGYVYSLVQHRTLSLNERLSIVYTHPYLYIQSYKGAIISFSTSSGRVLRVTPEHPVLCYRHGKYQWVKAKNIVADDSVTAFDSNKLTTDSVLAIRVQQYQGKIFDLMIPSYHNFIEAAGGIVCHNTTLTEAITGKWTSAHSEELRRGITIRVGYADAAVYKCSGCSPPLCYNTDGECSSCGGEAELQRVISIVDSPGHESLMANMLSGAALMDGALVVIAANEPVPQPQTKEHVQALQMIGVKNLVIVQNKIDLVTYTQALDNMEKINAFMQSYGFKDIPVIPVSAQKRLNIDALIQAMEEFIPTPKRDASATPLMSVLRSFDVNLPGTPVSNLRGGVVGGTLLKGSFSVGDEIEMKPGIYDSSKGKYIPITTKIVSLGTSAGLVDKVFPGGLVAVGTSIDPYFTKSDSLVGNLVGAPGTLPEELNDIVMTVSLFDSVVGILQNTKVEPLKMNEVLRLNIATATTAGAVTSIRGNIATIKLAKPVCPPPNARVAISRRIADRWRLIGSGMLQS